MNDYTRYFSFSALQQEQLQEMIALYREWNEKINLVSRKDIDNIFEHHILHSLVIGKYVSFALQSAILDVGTGGGFPGLPLAILFPQCSFTLIDSVAKKIRAVEDIKNRLQLPNVTCICERAEEEKGLFDFVVSRAVMPLPDLFKIVRKNISKVQKNAIPNGIIVLKGGTVDAEIQPFRKLAEVLNVSNYFKEEFFSTKKIIYLPV